MALVDVPSVRKSTPLYWQAKATPVSTAHQQLADQLGDRLDIVQNVLRTSIEVGQ